MPRWKLLLIIFLVALILLIIGDSRGDVLETHNNGAGMCMACIGLD
ncbi:MAG: hypothetical protein HQL29_03490 [Candidatus Omnitrophica bacterium]|nr:hypothetical protein [Candidatus Omnitrophota bacterium]